MAPEAAEKTRAWDPGGAERDSSKTSRISRWEVKGRALSSRTGTEVTLTDSAVQDPSYPGT